MKQTIFLWMVLQWKAESVNLHLRWTLNLNASLYDFKCSQNDGIYQGNPWAEVLLQMLISQEGSTSDLYHQHAGKDIF